MLIRLRYVDWSPVNFITEKVLKQSYIQELHSKHNPPEAPFYAYTIIAGFQSIRNLFQIYKVYRKYQK